MARGGGDQEGLQVLPLNLDEMSHHGDSSVERLMSISFKSHHLPLTVEAVRQLRNALLLKV